MMRTLPLVTLIAVLALAVTASAQTTAINDIQVYTDTGLPASPFDGTTVTIRGVLTVEKGTYNSGTHYVQDATGGLQIFDTAAPALVLGDTVEVTGTVSNFFQEIQLGSGSIWTFVNSGPDPAALPLTVSQVIDNDGSGTLNAADYEIVGTLVSAIGTISFTVGPFVPGINWSFNLVDGTDTLFVFLDRDTAADASGVNDGDLYQVTGPIVNFNGTIEMKPRRQADLVENPGNPFPQVAAITPNPWTPLANQSVTVTAEISDNGSIASADLFFRDTGVASFTKVAMTNTVGSTYEATIPAPHTSTGIEYYVQASDDTGQITSVPGDAPLTSLNLAVGTTPIVTIQSSLAPGTDASALVGTLVNVEGIVTVAPGELQSTSTSQFIIEDAAGGEWSGLFVFEGSGANVLFRGDRIRISGTVNEFSGTTQVLPQRSDAVEVLSFNNPLPPIPKVSATTLDTAESWENVIVSTYTVSVVDTIPAFGEWVVADPSDSTLVVDPAPGVSIFPAIGDDQRIVGMLDTRFARHDITPRDDTDITIVPTVTGVGDRPVGYKPASLAQVFPNPFNPQTSIRFVVREQGPVELAIFDQRGARVRTLQNGKLDPGEYVLQWDGTDHAGRTVASGVYYARLRFGTHSPEVQKLSLVK